jgi:peptidase C39-like protein
MKNVFLFPALVIMLALSGCLGQAQRKIILPEYWGDGPEVKSGNRGITLIDIKGLQQTQDYTCGPAALISLLRFYGKNSLDEMQLAKAMKTNEEAGTTPENMAEWLKENGFNVQWGENGSIELIRENLSKNIPTLIEWSDWGGHWVLAIGYDTRDTETFEDDIIIFADPCDCHDDKIDGITWFNAQRFDYMWYDALLFGKVMHKVYITAVPNKPF